MVWMRLPSTLDVGTTQERTARTIDSHRTRATSRHATAKLGARHAQHITQQPEQQHGRVGSDLHGLAIDVQCDG